jgi:hypothetical protein
VSLAGAEDVKRIDASVGRKGSRKQRRKRISPNLNLVARAILCPRRTNCDKMPWRKATMVGTKLGGWLPDRYQVRCRRFGPRSKVCTRRQERYVRHSGWGSCIASPAVDSESMGIRRSRVGDEWSDNYLSCDESSSRSRRGGLKLGESFCPAAVEITC